MNIAVIGSGNVGGALAQRWIEAGHAILIGAKFPLSEKNVQLAAKIGADRFAAFETVVQQSDVVLIATPPTAIFDVIEQMGDVSGKSSSTPPTRSSKNPNHSTRHTMLWLKKQTEKQ